MTETGRGSVQFQTAMQTIERRDAHIERLNEKLRASRKVIEAARNMSNAVGSPRTGHDAPMTLEGFLFTMRRHQATVDAAIEELDKIDGRQLAVLRRLQGKKVGLPGRAP